MTAFADMMSAGFAEAVAVMGGQAITSGVVTRNAIISNVDAQRVLKETGFAPTYQLVAEVTRADAISLNLYPMETTGARPQCTVGGRTYKRVNLEDDLHDPMVRLHLQNLV